MGGGRAPEPPGTHGILGRVSRPRLLTEACRPRRPDRAPVFRNVCADAEGTELSKCLSKNFNGSEVRSPSVVCPGGGN